MAPLPADCYLHDQDYLGYKHGDQRWRSQDGDRLYTWDELHQHIEAYDKRGYHVGVLDATTGIAIGEALKGRRISV